MATHRSRSVIVGLIPSIAYTLHDLVFQLRDNQHEATPGFFLTVGGLLLIWGLAGYWAVRGADGANTPDATLGAVTGSGAIAALVSVAFLSVTFIVLNNVFVDRMSYEPDRIRAFQQSGYLTMRAYVNHELVLSWFFPVLAAVAAAAGAAGALIGATVGYHHIPARTSRPSM
jgi:hypothetical protein